MTVRKPLAAISGDIVEIPAGDTIDPTYLSSSGSSVPLTIASSVTFTVADNTQVPFAVQITTLAGGQIITAGTGCLAYVT